MSTYRCLAAPGESGKNYVCAYESYRTSGVQRHEAVKRTEEGVFVLERPCHTHMTLPRPASKEGMFTLLLGAALRYAEFVAPMQQLGAHPYHDVATGRLPPGQGTPAVARDTKNAIKATRYCGPLASRWKSPSTRWCHVVADRPAMY